MEKDEATIETYRWIRREHDGPHNVLRGLADALRDMVARVLELEYLQDFPFCDTDHKHEAKCKHGADWQTEADRLLMGEEPPIWTCPHCGRSNQQTYPVVVPYFPPPYITWGTTDSADGFATSTDTVTVVKVV